MKKIEKRTVTCLALTLFLLLGLALFLVRFLLDGGDWASFAANRHLYNSQGQLSVGRVLDRDGDVLSWVDESGQRCYYSNATVRKATLHAVGDPNGAIGTGALVAFADQLSGYNLLTGADNPFGHTFHPNLLQDFPHQPAPANKFARFERRREVVLTVLYTRTC